MTREEVFKFLERFKHESINRVYKSEDGGQIVLESTCGQHICLVAEADCCNSVWFEHLQGFEAFDGARVRFIKLPEHIDEHGFVHIVTDRGRVTLEVRNDNGESEYEYGGEVDIKDEFHIHELKEVKGDF